MVNSAILDVTACLATLLSPFNVCNSQSDKGYAKAFVACNGRREEERRMEQQSCNRMGVCSRASNSGTYPLPQAPPLNCKPCRF
uniref:Putative secreted protein n=1 Tax=Ixodes scapularis TaxID=6945 RepID=A0A4D5RZU3_IXOSC